MEKVALERMALESVQAARQQRLNNLKDEVRNGKELPMLSEMVTFEQYRGAIERYSSRLVIAYLFLLADYLLTKNSHGAFVTYFRISAPADGGTGDIDENFRKAFGMSVTEFQAQLDAYLQALTR